jgi:hypothetical protein
MNLINSPHHEGHEDLEDFSRGCITLRDHPKGEFNLGNNPLFFFVLFVVKQGNLV